MLVYVEAKLNADISMRTTYDDCRNQIVRNIDCLLESAAGRDAAFWMFVREAGPGRAYYHLIKTYQQNPEALIRELPHRDPAALKSIARNLTILTWRDIASDTCDPKPEDDDLTAAVKRELLQLI